MKFDLMDVDLWSPPRSQSVKRPRSPSVSSTSDVTSEGGQGSRGLKKRKARRSRRMVDAVMENSDLSLLEKNAVGPRTHKMYQGELNEFKEFAVPRGLDWEDATTVDRLTVAYLNKLYLEGFQASRGDRLTAALLHFQPKFGKLGQENLPRTWRALRGFRKLTPGKSRLAYPLMVWAAMAVQLRQMGRLRMALFVLVSVCSYARPSELIRLQVYSLVRPSQGITRSWSLLMSPEERPHRSKTREFDNSVSLDSPWLIFLGPHVVRVPQTESSIQPVVGLRLQPVVHRVQEGCNCLGSGADTLPSQTLRSFDRSGPQLPVPVGGSEKRTVEVPEQRTEVRKVSKVGGNSREFVSGTPKPLQTLRGKPWGYHVGVPNRSRVRKKHIVGQYVMDLFAGKGGVSLACEKLGYTSKQWDIIHGPLHDLTDPKVVQRLLRDIRKGRVLAVMMAPICASFSRARDRTKVIRNVRFPWGIPRRFLSEKERLSVSVGNKCFHTCIRLIEELNALQIPWILENPWSSRCWNLPPIRRLLQTSEAFLYRGDFCQWGARWKKPTGFMCNHVLDVHRLQRPCSGRNGFCSRSGRRHFLLTGTGPGGQTWTQIAQPYPSHLNMDLAHVLTSKYHATSVF